MLYHGGPGKSISREEIDYESEVLSWFLKEGAGEVRIASVNIFSISGILGLPPSYPVLRLWAIRTGF